jgi:WhiB family transcriptional regulator, redox-sensing transcriptional regulator
MTALWPTEPGHPPAPPGPTGWQQHAACRDEDPDLFLPPEEEHGRYAAFRETLAKRICLRCPVLGECTAYALAADERYGVWGGLTPAERDRLRRRRA